MLNFITKYYRVFCEIALWLNLIIFTNLGLIWGIFMKGFLADRFLAAQIAAGGDEILMINFPLFGAICGFIIGMLINIGSGGITGTFISINKNLETNGEKLDDIYSILGQIRGKLGTEAPPVLPPSFFEKHQPIAHTTPAALKCPECSTGIPAGAVICGKCGCPIKEGA